MLAAVRTHKYLLTRTSSAVIFSPKASLQSSKLRLQPLLVHAPKAKRISRRILHQSSFSMTLDTTAHQRLFSSSSSVAFILDNEDDYHRNSSLRLLNPPVSDHGASTNDDFSQYLVELSSPLSQNRACLSSTASSASFVAQSADCAPLQPASIDQRWNHFLAFDHTEILSENEERYSSVSSSCLDTSAPPTTVTSPETVPNVANTLLENLRPASIDTFCYDESKYYVSDGVCSDQGGSFALPTSFQTVPVAYKQCSAMQPYDHQDHSNQVRRNAISHDITRNGPHLSRYPHHLVRIEDMTVAELEANGWYSSWPHHTNKKSELSSVFQNTSVMPPQIQQKANGRQLSKRAFIDEQRQTNDRQFYEVKSLIQSIPKSSDPARFQQNGRCLIACDACKRRKMRCTNEFPSCANCDRRGTKCSYAEKVRTRGRAKSTARRTPSSTVLNSTNDLDEKTSTNLYSSRRDSVLSDSVDVAAQDDQQGAFRPRKQKRLG